ncbi:MAG: hypothetical protein M3N93_11260 [Acidobacteriota bacterium]|nr:hypothetical protein [Acidobacteriota bacterium]
MKLLISIPALLNAALYAATLPAPTISAGGVVPLNSKVSTIQPVEWISIYGTNLASSTASWTGDYPTTLNGTSVTINGKPAYLSYVSPGQINLQTPNDTGTGSVPVVVTTGGGTATATVTLAQFAPSFSLLDSKHATGIIIRSDGSGTYGGGAYDIVGPTGSSLGYKTVAARPGDVVELFAVGLGPTSPSVQAGQPFNSAAPTVNPVTVLINNVSVTPAFAGLSSSLLDQINLTIPANAGVGDVPLSASVGGVQTPSGVVISLQAALPLPTIQSVSASLSSVTSGNSVTGTVTLTAAAPPGGATVSLVSLSSFATVASSVTVPAGSTSATFSISASTVTASQTAQINVSYNGSVKTVSFTVTPAVNPLCATVGGLWNVSETGSANATVTVAGQTDSAATPISGGGSITIAQTNCSISFNPLVESGLLNGSSGLARTGTLTGNNVSITGQLTLPASVESAIQQQTPGLIFNSFNVGSNVLNGSGSVSGNTMRINETGTFSASGTLTYSGVSAPYSLTVSTSSTATLNWASGTRPTLRAPEAGEAVSSAESTIRTQVVLTSDGGLTGEPTGEQRDTVPAILRVALMKAFGF